MKRDLSELYSELGLQPGCTLEQLKLAYRRRISKLHPDHGHATHDAGVELHDLASLYDAATRFHRRHGRLPGASADTGDGGDVAPRHAATAKPSLPAPSQPAATTAIRLPLVSLLLPVVAVLVLLLLSRDWLSPKPASDGTSALETPPPTLETGMDEAAVLAIQGRPQQMHDGRWQYGASWLQFERGRLVDWHDSQDYPLKVATAAPAPPLHDDSAR